MALGNALFWTQHFIRSTGVPYSGARVFHYEPGTLTARTVWTDGAKATPAAQPVVGDNQGRVEFFADGTYRLQVRSSVADGDLLLYDWDPVELHHPTATLRGENQALSLPSASAALRGSLFATIDGAGDVTLLSILKDASTWQNILFAGVAPGETVIWSKGANLTASTTLTLGSDGNYFEVDGSGGPIDTISTKPAGTLILLRMNSTPTFTHNATSLILEGAVDLIARAGTMLLIMSEGTGNWREIARAQAARVFNLRDARTATVAVPLTLQAQTTGTPAADIGVGQTYQAQSADEDPSDFGRTEFVASDVGAGSEDTYFQVLLRVAGAALSDAYRFVATTAFRAIFTHANAADRTYTLPDETTELAGSTNTLTLTNKSINANANTITNIGTPELVTATGSASVSGGFSGSVTMNDFAFFPSISGNADVAHDVLARIDGDGGDTVGRFHLGQNGSASGTTTVRWRYITSTDTPTIWVAYDPATGELKAAWTSDDPTPNDEPGVAVDGAVSVKYRAEDLPKSWFTAAHRAEAKALIAAKRWKLDHLQYRALQTMAQDAAPSRWIMDNCKVDLTTQRLRKR